MMNYYYISLFIVAAILVLGSNVLSYFGLDENRFQLLMLVLALVPVLSYQHRWRISPCIDMFCGIVFLI